MILAIAASPVALGQSAMVVFSHNDPDGIVDPGQTVRITVRASWTQGWTLGAFGGDAAAVPDAGIASNPVNGFGPVSPILIRHGVPVLGSIRGFSAAVSPGSQFYPPGFYVGWAGIDALTYDWTAPPVALAGTYSFGFNFVPASASSIFLYPGSEPWTVAPLPVPTTVVSTSLVVTPAPATAFVLGGVAAWGPRRRGRA